ncbi:hypothetical protein U6A24_03920 [Aquimarina gracilis]|uniref:Uncharacterized protein n=2 Tax=Aquimarina gracilis TaxID=874422 RepID=A0ABU5ZRB9_9FLAO|nr:hypothetical protein [Aquimarina gracilis]MEB3344593.1 hypothetical protein [Aquimarina gracilis]
MNKSWPVLFGFDSKGRASNITRLYREAAEEFGYIIAVSNFLEDQSLEEKTKYLPVFMDHIFSLFPIQQGRVYVTGIDEDARLMSLLPVFYRNKVFGVITIGDSHYYDSRIKMGKNFSYFGVLNTNNHRLRDFQRNAAYLKRRGVEADILSYEGPSEYPYPKLLKKPLSTFTLQGMLKGRMPRDSVWVENLFQKELKQVEIELRKGKFLYALEEVKRIRNKYHLFFDTNDLREKEKQIKRKKGYRKEKRLYTKYVNKESYYRQTYVFLLEEDMVEKKYENLGWWHYQMSELDSILVKKEKYAKDMVHRVKGFLKHSINDYKTKLSHKPKDFEKKIFLNILSTIVDKKDYNSYFSIISLSTQDMDYETALFYLEKLLENDFKDLDALYNIEGTLPLRITKEYNNLIKKHLGSSRYFFSK